VNTNGGEFAIGLLKIKGNDWRASASAFTQGTEVWNLNVPSDDIDGLVLAVSGLSTGGDYRVKIN
jgi:hypothetical protein